MRIKHMTDEELNRFAARAQMMLKLREAGFHISMFGEADDEEIVVEGDVLFNFKDVIAEEEQAAERDGFYRIPMFSPFATAIKFGEDDDEGEDDDCECSQCREEF